MNRIRKLAALPVAAAALAIVLLGSTPASAAAPSASVSPSSGVKSGQSITVTGTGFPAGAVFLVECAKNTPDGSGCDKANIGPATADASGAFSGKFTVKTGGANQCPASGTCYILATTATQKPSVFAEFTLGSAGGSSSTPPSTGGGSNPTGVNAGSGGHAGSEDVPIGVFVLAAVGALGLGFGVRRFARR